MARASAIPAANDSVRRLARRSGQLLAANGVTIALAAAQAVVVARVLGPADFGRVALVTVSGSLVFQVFDFRTSETVVRYVVGFREQHDDARVHAVVRLGFLLNAATGTAAALVTLAAAPLFARHLLDDPGTVHLFGLFAPFLVFSSVQTVSASVLRSFDRFATLSAYTVTGAVLRFASVLSFLAAADGPGAVLLAQSLGMALYALAGLVLAKGVLGREIPAPRGDRIPLAGMWAEVWRFMLSTNLSGLFSLVTKESDVFFLGMFAAPATVGRYRLARTVAQFVMLFGDAIVGALYPQAVRLAHESTARLWRFLRRVTSGLAAAVVPGVVVTVVFAEQILAVAGGDEFQGAAGVLRVLVCGFGIATVLTWSRPAMLALGRPHAATVLNAVLAVGQLAATLVLVPRFGIMATAWITASLYATGTIVLATAVRQAARDGTAFETRRVASDPG